MDAARSAPQEVYFHADVGALRAKTWPRSSTTTVVLQPTYRFLLILFNILQIEHLRALFIQSKSFSNSMCIDLRSRQLPNCSSVPRFAIPGETCLRDPKKDLSAKTIYLFERTCRQAKSEI